MQIDMVDKDPNLLWALALGIPLEKLNFEKPDPGTVPQAPNRHPQLTEQEFAQAVRNHLRYFPSEMHEKLALDFAEELRTRGHIWMERLRPTEYEMKAHPIDLYPALLPQCKAIQLMIQNNLDPNVAQYPHQLTTYGGNGCVFANWAQYHLTMQYLSEMQEDQTLVMYSGHPMGLFPSNKEAPRVVITNGMVIPNYSSKEMYEKMYAMGCTMYGQMTAGSYCYIGSQGIVHGTAITIINAGRKYLGLDDLRGKVLVTSGLGGMSGAQPKAGLIAGCVCVTAEVNEAALMKRYRQGWVKEVTKSVEETIVRIKHARANAETTSIAYLGNVVELWEALAQDSEMLVDLGSDQTSLHDPYGGGYYPVQVSYEEGKRLITDEPARFRALVQESLRRQVAAINTLTTRGMRFWDYGNSFLLEASRAGADIWRDDTHREFRYPSYVQDIMGDIFSLGFGPFRWVCTSGDPQDLAITDVLAAEVISAFIADPETPVSTRNQYADNLKWIQEAGANNLVIGSQARILYSDTLGRVQIALKFNEAIRNGQISAPVVLARDHHDVSGTDSPYRETANITDGSMFTADMAVQNVIGDGFRGATWVALHNGGGVGWGEVINGGFGLVLDGSEDAGSRAQLMLEWDTVNGISRRSWSGNAFAEATIKRLMSLNPKLVVTVPQSVSPDVHIPTK